MFATGRSPTGCAFEQAGLAKRAMADHTFADLACAKLAIGAFAIDTLWCQTFFVRQMPTRTEMQRFPRLAANVTNQRLDAVQQGVPNQCALNGCCAIADGNWQHNLGLPNQQRIDQAHLNAHRIAALRIL